MKNIRQLSAVLVCKSYLLESSRAIICKRSCYDKSYCWLVQLVEWSIDPGHTILTETENKQKRFNILPKIYDRNRKRQEHLKRKGNWQHCYRPDYNYCYFGYSFSALMAIVLLTIVSGDTTSFQSVAYFSACKLDCFHVIPTTSILWPMRLYANTNSLHRV